MYMHQGLSVLISKPMHISVWSVPETLRGQVFLVYPLNPRYSRFMVLSGLFYLNKIHSQISNTAKFRANMFNFSLPYLSHWGLLISSDPFRSTVPLFGPRKKGNP